MTPHVFIYINGIRNDPGDSDGWTDRAVTWTNIKFPELPIKGEKFEYESTALFRRLRQDDRAKSLVKMIQFYQTYGFRITLVGHSNGGDIIARVLRETSVDSAHLIAPAADGEDYETALALGRLGTLHIYGSKKDAALRLASWSRRLFGWAGLGYGSLGLSGEDLAEKFPRRVWDHSDDSQGHSTWFDRGPRFEQTMTDIFDHELLFE